MSVRIALILAWVVLAGSIARFQHCFRESPVTPTCKAFDLPSDDAINLNDLPGFLTSSALMGS